MAVYAAGTPRVTPQVVAALDELGRVFPDCAVSSAPDGQGGVFVVMRDVDLGELYAERSSWLGFHISYLHPASDVYPHYVRPDLARRDGSPLGPGFSPTTWAYEATSALQVSRRSNRWDPRRDSPALKALKVLAWLRAPT